MSDQTTPASQQGGILEKAQRFWLQWVEGAFPELGSRAYFLPPVHFNRVPMSRQSSAGQDVLVLQSAPGQAGQSTPKKVGQSTPGQACQSTPGQVGQSTPGQACQSTPGQVGQSTPGQACQSTPGQVGQSTPGQAGQSTPGQVGQSTPGQACQSTPGQAGQSTPGQVGQSTPGQAGLSSVRTVNVPAQPSSPQPVQDSDVREDAAMQRVLFCLQKMAEKNREILVGLTQLQFGRYLGEPCYAAAAAQLPVPSNLPREWKHGDFDVLLIHRQYGLVICEVKAFGDNLRDLNMSQDDVERNIRKKLKHAVSQLHKADAVLSHLVSDVAPGLRIIKTISFPNLTTRQVQQAISCDPKLTQDLRDCLGTNDSAITGLCLCSEQLSDPRTPWEVSSDVMRELEDWWQRLVAVSGPDSHMTCDVYKKLVARFCGPATTVTAPCTSPPRLCVKTLGQAVSLTGECYTAQITLFPEQVHLLNNPPSRLFLTGPPGTGKTVVLQLMAIEWLRHGDDVYIVSTFAWSRPVCTLLYHLLLQSVSTQLASEVAHGQPHLMQFEFSQDENVEKAVDALLQAARGQSLCVIADEPYGDDRFQTFCNKLLTQVPRLQLWAARCYHQFAPAPAGWQVECLTRPLRSPPAVVREVQIDSAITKRGVVHNYSERGVADHTDGPPVIRLYHRGEGHSGDIDMPYDCVTCGDNVASLLHSLHDGVTENCETATTPVTGSSVDTPPGLQWKDMVVLMWLETCENQSSEPDGENQYPEVVRQLRQAGVPVRVMTDDNVEDMATARSDVVWVGYGRRALGLERKVVVCIDKNADLDTTRLLCMSRCKAQLVIVSS